MRKIIGLMITVGIVAILAACGGGGGDGGVVPVTTEFTTQLLDNTSKIYMEYPTEIGQPGHPGTVREEITMSGSGGTYQVQVVQSYFDGAGTFIGSEPVGFYPVVLNPDGTITAAGVVVMSVASDQGAYLVVSGNDGVDVWTDDWYLDAPPAGWVAPTYAVTYQMVRNNTYEAGGNYQAYVDLTKSGLPITAAEFSTLTVLDGLGNPVVPASGPSFYDGSYVSIDCQSGPCSSSDYNMTGAWSSFTAMPIDDYTIVASMTDGSAVTAMVTYDEDLSLPVVTSASMLSAWSGNDLNLSWTNPVDPNWNRVTQLRLSIFDTSGAEVGIVKLNPLATTMTLTDTMLQDMYAKGDGTIASWRVQARAYVSGLTSNPQIARSYSDPVPVALVTFDFTTAMLDGISTIYIQYPTEVGQPGHPGTVREVIDLAGSTGTYTGKATQSYFDGSGAFIVSDPAEFFTVLLNPDGTLTANGIVDLTLMSNLGSYLVVSGDDGFDVWTDDWYLNTPPVGWVTPTYEVSYQMLSLNTFESSPSYYQAYVALTKNGLPISSLEYSSLTVTDDLGNN